MHTLQITNPAEKDLRKLPRPILERLHAKILTLRENPRPPGAIRLSGNLEGWRVRVGDYRILYQIDDDAQLVTVVRVRHRREVYRTAEPRPPYQYPTITVPASSLEALSKLLDVGYEGDALADTEALYDGD